jgi:multiple sugar transport system substrate-binding protein
MLRRVVPAGVILLLAASGFAAAAPPAKPAALNVGVVSGVEIRGLRAIAPMWTKATGVRLNLIEYPYPSLYEKMVTAFQAHAATFDIVNVVFRSDASRNALKFFIGQMKAISQPGPDTADAADRSRLVATGHAAQASVWPAEASDIVENPQVSRVIGKIAYTVLPAGPAGRHTPMMGNWLLGIPQAAKEKAWASRFIAWATSRETQRPYAAAGGIPFRTSILTDPGLNKRYPFFRAMAASLAAPPFWRPRTTEWSAVETILGTHVNAALVGTESPEQAADRAASEITQHMKEAGYIK